LHQFYILEQPLAALSTIKAGQSYFPQSFKLEILHARLLEHESVPQARSVLDLARVRFPKAAELWSECIRFEQRHHNAAMINLLLATALRDFPHDGQLWGLRVELEAPARRKQTALDAITACPKNPYVMCAVGKMFWASRNLSLARSWLANCTSTDPDFGDAWLFRLKLERVHGSAQQQQEIIKSCSDAQPTYGFLWEQLLDHPACAALSLEAKVTTGTELIDPLAVFAAVATLYSPPAAARPRLHPTSSTANS
jgi:pre-mRNA-processing factor 6